MAVAVAVLTAGCGGDDEAFAPREGGATTTTGVAAQPEPASREGRETSGRAGAARRDGDGAADSEGSAGGGEASAVGCEYAAPPGRLGDDAVAIELSGLSCDEGRRLAVAAALGQPAGANVRVKRDGFDCEPSTRERGADVTYSCSKGSRSARFEIVWTAAGGAE